LRRIKARLSLRPPQADCLDILLYMVKAVMSGRGDELIDLARTNLWR